MYTAVEMINTDIHNISMKEPMIGLHYGQIRSNGRAGKRVGPCDVRKQQNNNERKTKNVNDKFKCACR